MGLIDLEGNLVVPCEYDGIERLNYGGDYVYAVNGYACVEVADRYGYVALNGEVTCEPNYVTDTIIGLSMIVPDISGKLCIVAADGTITETDYSEFAPYPGGDGMLLQGQECRGKVGPDRLARKRDSGFRLRLFLCHPHLPGWFRRAGG